MTRIDTLNQLANDLLHARRLSADRGAAERIAKRLESEALPEAAECVDAAVSCLAEADQFFRYAMAHVSRAQSVEETQPERAES